MFKGLHSKIIFSASFHVMFTMEYTETLLEEAVQKKENTDLLQQ
jgi:hypothetical protein